MNKGEQEYTNLLLSVFKESERVLRDNGKLIFTFHHTKWQAWWTVLTAIIESGFRVADYFPVMSEYKVNPHIRNKQALNMDLVLICSKSHLAFEPLSLPPAKILRRVIDDLSLEAPNYNDNTLFLHFMGELLRTASSNQNGEKVDYNWFSEALTHFDDFLATIDRSDKNKTDPHNSKAIQLQLFEFPAL